jgi:hypothetical protein
MPSAGKLKLMVCSTVVGFREELLQICSTLQSYGYEVINSHFGTVKNRPGQSNEEACLEAVGSCDLAFAILRTRHGSGITMKEICLAISMNKPIWSVAHADIELFRQLMKQFLYDYDAKTKLPKQRKLIDFQKTSVLEDLRIIDLYNLLIQDHLPGNQRKGNWVQPFQNLDDILRYLEANLKDIDRIRDDM